MKNSRMQLIFKKENEKAVDRNFRFKERRERRNTMKGKNERKNQLTRKGELVTRRNMVLVRTGGRTH